LTPTWSSLLRLARGTDDTRIDGGFPSRFRTDQDQFTWQNDVELSPGRIAAGAEARRERVASDTAYARTRRTVRSAFAAWTGDIDAHTLEASLRVDDDSQFGTQPSGRVGWGLALGPAWRVSAAAGTGFKAPTFADLYFPFTDFGGGFTYAGNPNLEPERSRSVEAGVRYADGPWRAGATVFAQRIRDLIATNATGSTVENINRARIDGLTLDGSWRAGAWQASAQWTHQRALDEASDAWLLRRARNHARAALTWTDGPWRAGAEWAASGARDDTDFATFGRVRLGGYGLVNLHGAWQITPEVTLAARLSNAGDRRYEQARHYATGGRNLFVSMEYAAR
jgi:vitamin B12 transporter